MWWNHFKILSNLYTFSNYPTLSESALYSVDSGMCSTLLQWIQNELEQELDKALFDSNPTGYSSDGLASPQSDNSLSADGPGFGMDDYCTTADYRWAEAITCVCMYINYSLSGVNY